MTRGASTRGASKVHVALVPGFFGFANLGDLAYFGHVHAFLNGAYRARGIEPVLHVVKTHPTASVVRRTARLLETLATDAADDAPIHLVGHSSGGLDCRLLLMPGVELPGPHAVEPIAARRTTDAVGCVFTTCSTGSTPRARYASFRNAWTWPK